MAGMLVELTNDELDALDDAHSIEGPEVLHETVAGIIAARTSEAAATALETFGARLLGDQEPMTDVTADTIAWALKFAADQHRDG